MADFLAHIVRNVDHKILNIEKVSDIYFLCSTEQARFTNAQNWSNFCNSNFEPYLVFQKCNFLKAFVGLFVLVFLKYQYVGERDHYNTYVNVINSDKKYFTMPRVQDTPYSGRTLVLHSQTKEVILSQSCVVKWLFLPKEVERDPTQFHQICNIQWPRFILAASTTLLFQNNLT